MKPMKGWPYKNFPTSWFVVGFSWDLQPGDVQDLEFCGEELVMYRTEEGEVRVIDAHCPHLGAHFAHGGCVKGETLQCPWHGWRWDGEGKNVEIPFKDSPNITARLRTWHVREKDHVILVWHDAEGREPQWEYPGVPEFSDPDNFHQPTDHPDAAICYGELRVNPQLPIENVADPMHFAFVHGADRPAESGELELKDEYLRSVFRLHLGGGHESTWLTPEGEMWGTVEGEHWGLGLGVARLEVAGMTVAQMVSTTPIDHVRSIARTWIAIRKDGDGDGVSDGAAMLMREQVKQVRRDFAIWENQKYVDKPLFVFPEERNFYELRRWFRSFYPDGDGPVDEQPVAVSSSSS